MNNALRSVINKKTIFSFLLIPTAMYVFFVIQPLVMTFVYSFTDWDGVSTSYSFLGFKNFIKLLHDDFFWNAFFNNLKWLAVMVSCPTLLGLLLASLLSRDLKGAMFFKVIFYLPTVLSYMVTGLLWSWVYEPNIGILNLFLRSVGLNEITKAWLADPATVLFAIAIAATWRQTGFSMVLYLAGLNGVPKDIIESAKIDGATGWRLFWKIIFPLLKSSTAVVITFSLIDSFTVFDIIFTMTQGGPYRQSEVLAVYLYKEAFWNYRAGYASSIAVMLFVIVLIITSVYIRASKEEEL